MRKYRGRESKINEYFENDQMELTARKEAQAMDAVMDGLTELMGKKAEGEGGERGKGSHDDLNDKRSENLI